MTIEKKLHFQLETSSIAEISDQKSWESTNVVSVDKLQIAEMIKDDQEPFFVEFVAVHEGCSANDRVYSKEAVDSAPDAMIGVNMYKGHEEPGTAKWKYREPVGRIVSAKTEVMEIDGKKIYVAKGKAYISPTEQKLRSDIKKKMAGNVSILGDARLVWKNGDKVKTVTKLHKPLRSVDFCNPGTSGLVHAGVTAIVSEMAGDVEQETTESKPMTTRLTKDLLMTEYKSEITAIVSEQIDTQIQEIASQRKELAETKVKLNEEKNALVAQVSEMKTKIAAVEKDRDEMKQKFESERNSRIESDLRVFATAHVAEMIEKDDSKKKLFELASKRVRCVVVDGDFEKSKIAYKSEFDSCLAEVQKIAEMFSDNVNDDSDEAPKKKHANNPGKKSAYDRIRSSTLAKTGENK